MAERPLRILRTSTKTTGASGTAVAPAARAHQSGPSFARQLGQRTSKAPVLAFQASHLTGSRLSVRTVVSHPRHVQAVLITGSFSAPHSTQA
jgi:hypothetical protein